MGPNWNKKKLPCIFFQIHLHAYKGLENANIFLKMFPLLFSFLTSDHFIKLPFVERLLYNIHYGKHFK